MFFLQLSNSQRALSLPLLSVALQVFLCKTCFHLFSSSTSFLKYVFSSFHFIFSLSSAILINTTPTAWLRLRCLPSSSYCLATCSTTLSTKEVTKHKTKMTGSPGQTRPLMWINMASSWEKICKLIFFQILVGIWWHWVSRGHYLLVLGGTGSVLGGTYWYLIVLTQ